MATSQPLACCPHLPCSRRSPLPMFPHLVPSMLPNLGEIAVRYRVQQTFPHAPHLLLCRLRLRWWSQSQRTIQNGQQLPSRWYHHGAADCFGFGEHACTSRHFLEFRAAVVMMLPSKTYGWPQEWAEVQAVGQRCLPLGSKKRLGCFAWQNLLPY